MIQQVVQTRDETITMYKKFSKQKLAEMLYEANAVINQNLSPQTTYHEKYCNTSYFGIA